MFMSRAGPEFSSTSWWTIHHQWWTTYSQVGNRPPWTNSRPSRRRPSAAASRPESAFWRPSRFRGWPRLATAPPRWTVAASALWRLWPPSWWGSLSSLSWNKTCVQRFYIGSWLLKYNDDILFSCSLNLPISLSLPPGLLVAATARLDEHFG